jgi:RNA polymerase sigma factor (sigma-70 family)
LQVGGRDALQAIEPFHAPGALYCHKRQRQGKQKSVRNEKERAFDAYLAASARLGDRQALGRLAERWHPKLLAHAWRLTGEGELAADVTQEAWMQIIQGISRLNDTDAFAAWAFQIVTRRCAHHIKRRQRQRAGHAALARQPEPQPDEGEGHENRADLAIIRAAMSKLPSEQRAALGLFYLEGLRVAEIAVALNTAPGTIKTRLMHARNKLRAHLEGDKT